MITRAVSQAEPFVRAVREAGGLPVLMPALAIDPVPAITPSGNARWIIFISPNAVEHGLDAVLPHIERGASVAAIGPSTAKALSERNIRQPLSARDGFDSEALLRHPVFVDIGGQHVIIVRGIGGRALLPITLRQRGAHVSMVECYRRDRPHLGSEQVQYLEDRWAAGVVAVTTCLSVATLDNLLAMLSTKGQRMFMATPLLSPSARVLARAESLGHTSVRRCADGPEVSDLLASLQIMADAGQI
ncbi:MAG: uroporphyrinogen-III synthase [Pseudomonadota bacterium]